ncbi:hypothetical protein C8Q78DRAFT_479803 [Trametes maxima]|nr:hypothetical protein C8Q78DRAFT_479803 [Trametes maxima]
MATSESAGRTSSGSCVIHRAYPPRSLATHASRLLGKLHAYTDIGRGHPATLLEGVAYMPHIRAARRRVPGRTPHPPSNERPFFASLAGPSFAFQMPRHGETKPKPAGAQPASSQAAPTCTLNTNKTHITSSSDPVPGSAPVTYPRRATGDGPTNAHNPSCQNIRDFSSAAGRRQTRVEARRNGARDARRTVLSASPASWPPRQPGWRQH